MIIHHLNCGTLCPLSHPVINHFLPWMNHLNLVCHCLLIESDFGLILVDTGLGLNDVSNYGRLAQNFIFKSFAKPKLDVKETAYMQILELGFNPKDVQHIIATHLDADHVGGLADFPNATLHVSQKEWQIANNPKNILHRRRYHKNLWTSSKKIQTYDFGGDRWHGFYKIRPVISSALNIAFISLPGHTEGHIGVLLEKQGLLHAGDAFIHFKQLQTYKTLYSAIPYNKVMHQDPKIAEYTLRELVRLQKKHPTLSIFCSHDQTLFKQQMVKR